MKTKHPFDLVIGLDRSDQKADLHLIDTVTGDVKKQTLNTSPEDLHDWLAELRQRYPQGRVGLCLEQPACNLIPFLETYSWITLYPINPITLQKFREAFVTSRAKDDAKDARYLAELLLAHHDKLTPWQLDDSLTRQLRQLVLHRRAVVDERTGLTNRLKALLKQYFPQALALCGEDLWRPMATDFLLKWPTLQVLKKERHESIKEFYRTHGSRSETLLQERLQLIDKAIALTDEIALLQSFSLRVELICRELKSVIDMIDKFEAKIALTFAEHPDREIFSNLPGAGPTLAPRLLASIGSERDRFPSAESLQCYSGIAPVTKQSGGTCYIHRRYLCPKFLKQSFHEYAKESILHSRCGSGAFFHITLRSPKPVTASYLWRIKAPTNPAHVGEHIKKRRFELKLKSVDVRRILGVDKGTLTRWERGTHQPSKPFLQKISEFLGFNPFERRPQVID